jgi:hypothetical protein
LVVYKKCAFKRLLQKKIGYIKFQNNLHDWLFEITIFVANKKIMNLLNFKEILNKKFKILFLFESNNRFKNNQLYLKIFIA